MSPDPGLDGRAHSNVFCPVTVSDQPGGSLPDIEITETAEKFLSENHTAPFLLAVGLHKPHVPHKFPAEFLQFHPYHDIRLPNNSFRPAKVRFSYFDDLINWGFLESVCRFNVKGKKKSLERFTPLLSWMFSDFTSPQLPSVSWNPWTSLRRREDVAASRPGWPWGPLASDLARRIIQGYYSATTYIDSLVGRLLDRLTDNTMVVLLSDHG